MQEVFRDDHEEEEFVESGREDSLSECDCQQRFKPNERGFELSPTLPQTAKPNSVQTMPPAMMMRRRCLQIYFCKHYIP